jgi:hypothetical protein
MIEFSKREEEIRSASRCKSRVRNAMEFGYNSK